MLRLRQKLISFSVVSNKIAHNSRDVRKDKTINFYPIVGLKDIKLGTISLNQPNNQNFFTIQMMDEFFRFLNSYQHDHTVENVWIQNRGSIFLGGLSFQQMMTNPSYLDKLYKMTAMVAKLNKPIFSYVTGGVRNVGAYVLSMSSVALTDNTSSLRIDQVSKGFIPVAGGSHRLSRIPAKIGLYLALTGKKLTSEEMARLGLITGIVKQGVSSKQLRTHISKSNLFFREKIKSNYQDQRVQQWEEWQNILRKQMLLKHESSINQQQIVKNQQNIFARFTMNQYKMAQVNYENAKNPFNSFSDKPGRTINNYFLMRHQKAFDYLMKNELIEKSQYENIRLPGIPIDKILKIFSQNSLKEAIKELENDSSNWAQSTLKTIRTLNPLAASLTYELLQKAESLSWDQCLELQYKIAKKLLAQSTLSLEQTFSGSKYVLVNDYSNKQIEDISEEFINTFIKTAEQTVQQPQIDVPKYSLLPNSDYKDIPDAARTCMNQYFFDDIHFINQQKEMKRYLQEQKIDYRNKSYDIHRLREKIHQKKQSQLIEQIEAKRLEFIVNNNAVLTKFINERFEYIDQLSNEELQGLLNKITKSTFNDGIKDRFQEFHKTASIIGKEKKLEIFKNYRKTLIKKIVIDGIETSQRYAQMNEIFQGPLYFDQKGGNVHQTKNPHLKQFDPINKLSQQLQRGGISQSYYQNEGTEQVGRHIGVPMGVSKAQAHNNRIIENIARRYQQYPQQWQKAYQYTQMVKSAAQTSEQLAQYLQWGSDAYYSMIVNQPEKNRTYNQLAQYYLSRMKGNRNNEKNRLKIGIQGAQLESKLYIEQYYSQKIQTHHKSNAFIRDIILPKGYVTEQFQGFITPVLDLVLKHFEDKYFEEALQEKKLQLGEFDRYIYENSDRQFVEVYKNDILFVFSYLTVLKMKDILHNFKTRGQTQKIDEIQSFFRQYQINFHHSQTVESLNKQISNFLFYLLDVHTYTKAKIILPQNKLLDFLNRTKVFRQTNKRSIYPISFESILLMIAKDRTKLYNKVLRQFIPSQPQYLLEIASKSAKQIDSLEDYKVTLEGSYNLLQNVGSGKNSQKKSLITGYQYYLALFDSFIQRASGKYNFINDQTLHINPKDTKQKFSNIINMKQSSKEWLERISQKAIKNFFKVRLDFEKSLTKGELLAFDQELKDALNPQLFKLLLKYSLQSQIRQTKALFVETRHYEYSSTASEKQEQVYCQIRRGVKNPDAFKRLNNLKMAIDVHDDYMINTTDAVASPQQKQDLVDQRRQFTNYHRFPKQTYRRIAKQPFEYGEQKNFDSYLNNLGQKQMSTARSKINLEFEENQRRFKQQRKLTSFGQEIKSLKKTLSKNNNIEMDSLFKKLEQLI